MTLQAIRNKMQSLPLRFSTRLQHGRVKGRHGGTMRVATRADAEAYLRSGVPEPELCTNTSVRMEKELIDACKGVGGARGPGIRAGAALLYCAQTCPDMRELIIALTYSDIERIRRVREWFATEQFRLVPLRDCPPEYRDDDAGQPRTDAS